MQMRSCQTIGIPQHHSLHKSYYHLDASLSSTGVEWSKMIRKDECMYPQTPGGKGRGGGCLPELDPLFTQPSNKRVNIEADPPGGARHGAPKETTEDKQGRVTSAFWVLPSGPIESGLLRKPKRPLTEAELEAARARARNARFARKT